MYVNETLLLPLCIFVHIIKRLIYVNDMYSTTGHPDRWMNKSEEEQKNAEIQFKHIGEAYSVLSDPEKKQKYDRGVDPEDLDNPHAGHGHGFGGMDPNDIFSMFMGGMGGGGMGGGRGGMPGGVRFSYG